MFILVFLNIFTQERPLEMIESLISGFFIVLLGTLLYSTYLQKRKGRIGLIFFYLFISLAFLLGGISTYITTAQPIETEYDAGYRMGTLIGIFLMMSIPVSLLFNAILSKKMKAYLYRN